MAASSGCIWTVRRRGEGTVRARGRTAIEEPHAILRRMFRRQKTGSVVCVSCGYLVGVNDEKCYHCGRRNPGLWGFGPLLRTLGQDLGFVPFVTGLCSFVYVAAMLMTGGDVCRGGLMGFMAPNSEALVAFGGAGSVPVFIMHRWWTVLSASWLHGSLLHILFNIMWI